MRISFKPRPLPVGGLLALVGGEHAIVGPLVEAGCSPTGLPRSKNGLPMPAYSQSTIIDLPSSFAQMRFPGNRSS